MANSLTQRRRLRSEFTKRSQNEIRPAGHREAAWRLRQRLFWLSPATATATAAATANNERTQTQANPPPPAASTSYRLRSLPFRHLRHLLPPPLPPGLPVVPPAASAAMAASAATTNSAATETGDIQSSFQGANIDMIAQWLAKATGKRGQTSARSVSVDHRELQEAQPEAINLVYRALSLEGFNSVESSQSTSIVPDGQDPR